jgi:hypothetical protein
MFQRHVHVLAQLVNKGFEACEAFVEGGMET